MDQCNHFRNIRKEIQRVSIETELDDNCMTFYVTTAGIRGRSILYNVNAIQLSVRATSPYLRTTLNDVVKVESKLTAEYTLKILEKNIQNSRNFLDKQAGRFNLRKNTWAFNKCNKFTIGCFFHRLREAIMTAARNITSAEENSSNENIYFSPLPPARRP